MRIQPCCSLCTQRLIQRANATGSQGLLLGSGEPPIWIDGRDCGMTTPLDRDTDRAKAAFRFVTYNIRTGIGMDGSYQLERVIQTLADCSPDIVALQEVDVCWSSRSCYHNQVEMLAEALRMQSFFAPIYQFASADPAVPDRRFGLAILSRYPIENSANHQMMRLSTQVKNAAPAPAPGFADVQISINGTMLRVLNVQLDYRPDPVVRNAQVRDIFAVVGGSTPAATILTGDFNAKPDAPEMTPLNQVWTDAWQVAGIGDGCSYPADTPVKRIDRILLSPDLAVDNITVPDTRASDHRPVVADLRLLK